MLSLVADMDVTWGAASQIAEVMQITPIELEGPQMVGVELTPQQRKERARMAFAEMQQQCNTLKATARFRAACEGQGGGVLMMTVDGDKVLSARDDTFDKFFIVADNPYDDILKNKMLQAFLGASVVCPEDRDIITQLCIEVFFARDVHPSQVFFLKALGHDGKIRLLMLKVQRSRHGNEDQTTLYIEEAHPSRHLTPTPAARGFITCTFRHTTFKERVAVSRGGADTDEGEQPGVVADAGEAPVAAMMCAAFPITPSDACRAMESHALQLYARDIFDLPASKERLQAASASVCLSSLLQSGGERGKRKKRKQSPSLSSLPLLAMEPGEEMQARVVSTSQPASWEGDLHEEDDLLTMLEPILTRDGSSLLPDIV